MRPAHLFGTALLVSALAWPVVAQQPDARGGLRILPVRGNVFLLSGGGSNVVASV